MKQFNDLTILFVGGSAFALERILKQAALALLSEPFSGSFLVNRYFGLQLFKNNKFLGLLLLSNPVMLILMLIFLALIILLLRKELKKGKRLKIAALSLLISGAISNFLDRLIHGYVIDYLVLGPWVINLADLFILVGILLYLKTKKVKFT